MSFGDYLVGVIGLAAVAAAIGLAAVRLRARLLPGWSGAPARLVEVVLGLAALTVVMQLLAAIGLFEPGTLVGAAIAVGAAAYALLPGGGPRTAAAGDGGAAEPPPAPPIPLLHAAIALAAAAFVAAHWATGLQDVWARGMLTFDTLWYHGPFAARIAEEGSVWGLHLTDPLYLNWFYPQNSELLHGAGIALLERDLLSPLINFGWLGVSLLAAWCIGRPYGVAPLSLLAVALVLDTGPMVPREAGTPANDVAPVALLLAAAAVLINAWTTARPRGVPSSDWHRQRSREWWARTGPLPAAPIAIAGLAMGLALGTKLTISGAAAAMAVGVPLIAPPGLRRRALLLFLGAVAATAGFWFLRNLIHSGNPVPWLQELGPIDLPGPGRGLEGRDNFTVAHYIFVEPSTAVWGSFFLKAITNLFGPAWFLFLGLAAVGSILAVARPRTDAVRLLGAVAIIAAIAYLFTPLSAAGPEGQPIAFGINLRYLAPALALALALLTLEPRLTPERLRLPLLGGGIAALLLTSLYSDSAFIWDEPHSSIPAAALFGLVFVGAPVGVALLARRSAALATAVGGAVVLALAAVGWERQDDYLDDRYTNPEDFRFQLDRAVEWAKPRSGERIAVVGTSGAYSQYGFYGDQVSNHVQYVGRELGNGDFREIEKCAPFVHTLNEGDYDYLITTPSLDLNDPSTATAAPERGWVVGAEGAEELLREGRVSIFRLDGDVDPQACGARSARTGQASRE